MVIWRWGHGLESGGAGDQTQDDWVQGKGFIHYTRVKAAKNIPMDKASCFKGMALY